GVERVLGAKYPLLDPNKPPRRNGAPAEMDRACQIGQVAARLRGAGRADLAEGFQGFWADVRNARNTLAHAQLGFDGNDPPALDSRSIQKWVARFETLCQELAGLSGGSQ
ncbi:MAG TPA: hypothetical protein PLS90_17310, partial [Candidatus Sumerlaeota bacterium]|nr:hypothetical protein [Candidatus Sumerlaeota bacterium]